MWVLFISLEVLQSSGFLGGFFFHAKLNKLKFFSPNYPFIYQPGKVLFQVLLHHHQVIFILQAWSSQV